LPVETDLAAQYTQGKVEQRNIDNEISAAQISALYQHMPMVLAVNVVNSALVALVLASYMEQTRWWIFFGLVVSLTGVRAAGWRWYRYHRKRVEAKTIWTTFATVGSGLSGLLWGAGSTLLLPDNIVEQTFFAFVIGGMCAGALVSLSYYLPAFIALCVCVWVAIGRYFFTRWTNSICWYGLYGAGVRRGHDLCSTPFQSCLCWRHAAKPYSR
jgi:hypothetical protein